MFLKKPPDLNSEYDAAPRVLVYDLNNADQRLSPGQEVHR